MEQSNSAHGRREAERTGVVVEVWGNWGEDKPFWGAPSDLLSPTGSHLPVAHSAVNGQSTDEVRGLMVQSLSKSSTSKHGYIGEQAYNSRDFGGLPRSKA